MISISDLKTGMDLIISLFNASEAARLKERQRFMQFVNESFEQLKVVHADYIKNFSELQGFLDQEDWPTKETVKWLREKRTPFAPDRDQLTSFAGRIAYYKNFFPKNGLEAVEKESLQGKIYYAYGNFCDAVEYYLQAREGESKASWYSDFLDFVEESTRDYDKTFRELLNKGVLPNGFTTVELLEYLRTGKDRSGKLTNIDNVPLALFFPKWDPKSLGMSIDVMDVIKELRKRFEKVASAHSELNSLCAVL